VIQLEILNGSKAGTHCVARQFPFRVGRQKSAGLLLTDDGIWESHMEFTVRPREGCCLSARPECLTLVNGQPIESPYRLRNGDLIEAGSVKLRFVLSPTRSRTQVLREVLLWTAIAALCAGQLALIHFVLP
jgi:pSer/pThr/pTyr-binding forkhead associated (FHA) protein